MAEALGIAAAILQIVDTTTTLGRLVRRVKKAPSELLALNNELNELRAVLEEIHAVCGAEPDGTRYD